MADNENKAAPVSDDPEIARLRSALATKSEQALSLKRQVGTLRKIATQRGAQADEFGAKMNEYAFHIARLKNTPLCKASSLISGAVARGKKMLEKQKPIAKDGPATYDGAYTAWIGRHDTLSDADRAQVRQAVMRLNLQPEICLIVPVRDFDEQRLTKTVRAALAQLYGRLRLFVVCPATHYARIAQMLNRDFADDRLECVASDADDYSETLNSVVRETGAAYIGLLSDRGLLAEDALYEVVAELNEEPDADLIYFDEDNVDADGTRYAPLFRPEWNRESFLACRDIGAFLLLRTARVAEIGGFRTGLGEARYYDAALRVTDLIGVQRIRRIPAVLVHNLSQPGDARPDRALTDPAFVDAIRRAKRDYFVARAEAAEVCDNSLSQLYDRIRRPVPSPLPLVSIIIPTRNRHDLLSACVDGMLNRTSYKNIEMIIIDHQSDDRKTIRFLEKLKRDARVRVMPYTGPFNFADMNNRAVAMARGELIALCNNDIDVINPDWLSEMASLAAMPENGVIGAKLLFASGDVQHAGILLGIGGIASHVSAGATPYSRGYLPSLLAVTNISAVTGACMVMRKNLFEAVGGFDAENLRVVFNDVDLCIKIRERGFRNVWTPFALLHHYESETRGEELSTEQFHRLERERACMTARWGDLLASDPYFSPNYSLISTSLLLAEPPRWSRSKTR